MRGQPRFWNEPWMSTKSLMSRRYGVVERADSIKERRMTVKAFMARKYGGPEVMGVGELPEPSPRKGEVVVQVVASSVNPVDWKIRSGLMNPVSGRRFPKAYGCDFSGTVQALGPGVSRFGAGDAVYGLTPVMFGKPGAHAERLAVAADKLRPLPEGVTFAQAAALPVAALTAWDGWRKCGDIRKKNIVVVGATGGVGHFALQMAKAEGATATAVCSTRNIERAQALGADHVIDYRTEDFTLGGKRYDIVFDAWGELGPLKAGRVLARRGVYVTTAGSPGMVIRTVFGRLVGGPRTVFAMALPKPQGFEAVEKHLIDGTVIPLIEHVYPLDRAAEAFEALERGGAAGKILIEVAQRTS